MKNNLKSDTKMCFWEMKFVSTQKRKGKKKKKKPNMISVLTEMIKTNKKKKKILD